MDYIYFFYGLGFIILAVVCFFLREEDSVKLPWTCFGLFGLIHGINEWLDLAGFTFVNYKALPVARLVVLAASYLFLIEFARQGYRQVYRKPFGIWIYPVLVIPSLSGCYYGVPELSGSLRYFLALPGGLLSAAIIYGAAVKEAEKNGRRALQALSGFLCLYTFVSGVVVPASRFGLAPWINYGGFYNLFGLRVELLRGALAVILAAVLMVYLQICLRARYGRKINPLYVFWVFPALVLLLIAGGLAVEFAGRHEDGKARENFLKTVDVAAASLHSENIIKLKGALADRSSTDYRYLLDEITSMRKAGPKIRFAYLLGKRGDDLIFLLDTEPEKSKDYSAPGDVYFDAPKGMKEMFISGGHTVVGPYTDRWGEWITALSPVHDVNTGRLAAVLGMDTGAKEWQSHIAIRRLYVIGMVLLIALLLMSYFVFTERLNILAGRIAVSEERLEKLNSCMLSFGEDPNINIRSITRLCGEILGADCALYSHIKDGLLCSVGQWNAPPDFNPVDKPEGHICSDVIQRGGGRAYVVRGPAMTLYAQTDPNVRKYGLKTYIGYPVKCGNKYAGSICVVYVRDFAPSDEDVKFLGIAASAIGAEELRSGAENALRESEEKFKAIFDQTFQFIGMLSSDGILLAANKTALDFSGIKESDVIGKPFWEGPWWSHSVEMQDCLRRAIKTAAGGEFIRMEVTHPAKDGSVRNVDFSLKPIRDSAGKVVFLIPEGRDITDRKKAEEALRLVQFSVDRAAEAIFWTSVDGRIRYVNERACGMFGYTREEFFNMSVRDLSVNLAKEKWAQYWDDLKARGSFVVEDTGRMKDRRTFPIEKAAYYLKFEGVEYNCVFIRDITDMRKVELARRMSQIGELAGGVAHEVNNPLMIISGRAQLSLKENIKNKEVEENLQIIVEQCECAKEIIRRLLTFAAPGGHEKKKADINVCLDLVLNLVEYQCSQEKIRIVKKYGASLPPVRIDDKQIQEALMNIVRNAIEALPEEGGTITVSSSKKDDKIQIDIQDTGCGMTDDVMKKIFNPFFTTKEQRTGLGIPVSFGIIKSHNGALKYESEPEKGTKATIILPGDA